MVEIHTNKFSNSCKNNKYLCVLEANDEYDVKKVKKIALAAKCTGFVNYKDCAKHVFVIRVMFRTTEEKAEFIRGVRLSTDRKEKDKTKKEYA